MAIKDVPNFSYAPFPQAVVLRSPRDLLYTTAIAIHIYCCFIFPNLPRCTDISGDAASRCFITRHMIFSFLPHAG